MRRFMLIAVTCSVISTMIFSHAAADDSPWSYGLKAGLNLASAWGDNTDFLGLGPECRLGLSVNAFLAYAFSDWFRIQPELVYSQKGASHEAFVSRIENRHDYFEIPILVKLTIPNSSIVTPSLFVGPAVSVLLKTEYEYRLGPFGGTGDDKDPLKPFDSAIVFGGGLDIEVGPGEFIVEARYSLGMTDIWDEDMEYKNSVITVLLGYGF